MQLSVFLTPIFAKQLSVGFGVCAELAIFSQFKTTLTSSSSQSFSHELKHSQHHLSAETPTPSVVTSSISTASPITASKVVSSSLLQPQVEPHHQNHAKCEFCLLLGHSVLPPLHVVIAVLLTIAISTLTVKAKIADAVFLNQNKNLRPQGRAPPLFIS